MDSEPTMMTTYDLMSMFGVSTHLSYVVGVCNKAFKSDYPDTPFIGFYVEDFEVVKNILNAVKTPENLVFYQRYLLQALQKTMSYWETTFQDGKYESSITQVQLLLNLLGQVIRGEKKWSVQTANKVHDTSKFGGIMVTGVFESE